ncbi:hypothetical protein PHLGIDRAFT_213934 [Phlebiopsis gigantea 11061_1 CR5-6]|uniref:RRM domain-containing protein n=1 Tax=Phlebiopsis gigantea (strain 11061_1 CR5-6) TaxID=745531 RepID=A0A0C3S2S3_PHLG1|nr:hypothetical protein PHLGIDRAFT_213934 [Phlebiopsis gigantea 11061_1 CR5-6]
MLACNGIILTSSVEPPLGVHCAIIKDPCSILALGAHIALYLTLLVHQIFIPRYRLVAMTKGSRRFTPHPLLSTGQRELYMQVSRDVTWYRVKTIMKPIGDVKCVEKVVDKEGNQRLRIRFEDVYHAEMALATLNTCTKVLRNSGIREEIRFSHTPRMESAMPEEPICRQYLKGNISIVNNQTLFEWFRQAGPLVMCRIQDDIPVVQYWSEMDAEFARQSFRKFHFKLQCNASLKLLTFSPFCVVAKNLPQQVVSSRMKEVFSLYGEIIHWRLLNQREEGYRCYVSYSEEHEGQRASIAADTLGSD